MGVINTCLDPRLSRVCHSDASSVLHSILRGNSCPCQWPLSNTRSLLGSPPSLHIYTYTSILIRTHKTQPLIISVAPTYLLHHFLDSNSNSEQVPYMSLTSSATISPPWEVLALVAHHLDPRTLAIASYVCEPWTISMSSDLL